MRDKRILLVDDDRASKFFVRIILIEENINCIIDEAPNGKDALDFILKGSVPDIILLDINMPVMNGFEFLLEYKQLNLHLNHSSIYVLSTTITDDDLSRIRALNIVEDIFEKPFNYQHIKTIREKQSVKR